MGYRNGEQQMTIQLVQLRDPFTSIFTTVSYRTFLGGTDQILMDTYEYDSTYSSGITYIRKEPIKIMLDSIEYDYRENEIFVNSIEGYGFRRDGKIRAKSFFIHKNNPQFADLLPQIPNSFHDNARDFFDKTLKKLSEELMEARQKGLQIK